MDIRFINVEHSIKFKNMRFAVQEANRLKMVMDRFAKRYKLPFSCIFVVSNLSLRFGEYVIFHNGKRGRPIKKAVSKLKLFDIPEGTAPHLHIVIIYTEHEKQISNKLVTSIKKLYGEESSRAYDITARQPLYFLQYIIRQGAVLRFVEDFTNTIPFDLKKFVRLSLKQNDNIYFHANCRKDSLFKYPAG